MIKIQVTLPQDRTKLGHMEIRDAAGSRLAGPFRAFGKADNATAAHNGNPDRNPERAFGDTPLGEYHGAIGYELGTLANVHKFGKRAANGSIPVVILRPVRAESQAWHAQLNGRSGLLIHFGALASDGRALRPTNGCVRGAEPEAEAFWESLGTPDAIDVSIVQEDGDGRLGRVVS